MKDRDRLESLVDRLRSLEGLDEERFQRLTAELDRPAGRFGYDEGGRLKVALFDARSYDLESFEGRNDGRFAIDPIEASLNEATAPAAEDPSTIAQMKQGVMLINTSRGGLIDTPALVEGLKSRKIGSAGLDVYEEEAGIFFHDMSGQVLSDDVLARLMTFQNVVVTSHQAFFTHEALRNIADTTLASIAEFESGKRGADLTHAVREG